MPDLIDSLEEAQAARRLTQHLKTLTHPPLLVVDELGYLLVTRSGAIFFFQLINRRYGRASTVLTSNKGFEEWGRILGDEMIAAPRSSTACSTVATSSTDSENPENPESRSRCHRARAADKRQTASAGNRPPTGGRFRLSPIWGMAACRGRR